MDVEYIILYKDRGPELGGLKNNSSST